MIDVRPLNKSFKEFDTLLRLDPDTGKLYWKESRGRVKAGDEAGTITNQGYVQVRVNGRFYKRSRIVWLLTYGEWPQLQIDHWNKKRTDDRPINLRDVTGHINQANKGLQINNTTGHAGIRFHKGAFEVTQNKVYLGRFSTIEAARAARGEY